MKVKITLIVVLTLMLLFTSSNMMHLDHWDVSENLHNFAKSLTNVEPDSVLYFPLYGDKAYHYDLDIIYKITWKLVFEKDVKIIIHLMDKSAGSILEEQFTFLIFPELYNKTEGVDYIILPYTCMDEQIFLRFFSSIKGTIPWDNINHDLHFVPLLENITSFHDVDWYVGGDVDVAVNVLSEIYGVKILCTGLVYDVLPYVGTYYDPLNGPVYGYIAGLDLAVEFMGYTGFWNIVSSSNYEARVVIWGIISTVVVLFINQIYPLEELSKRFNENNVKHYDIRKPESEKK